VRKILRIVVICLIIIPFLSGCADKRVLIKENEGEEQTEINSGLHTLYMQGSPGNYVIKGLVILAEKRSYEDHFRLELATSVSFDVANGVTIKGIRVKSYGESEPYVYNNLISDTKVEVSSFGEKAFSIRDELEIDVIDTEFINQILYVDYIINGNRVEGVEIDRASIVVADLNVMGALFKEGDKVEFPLVNNSYTVFESAYEYIDDYDDYQSANIERGIYEIYKVFKKDSKIYYNLSKIGWLEVSSKFTMGRLIEPYFELSMNYKEKVVHISRKRDTVMIRENFDNHSVSEPTFVDGVETYNCSLELYPSEEFFKFEGNPSQVIDFECREIGDNFSYRADESIDSNFLGVKLLVSYEYEGIKYEGIEVGKISLKVK